MITKDKKTIAGVVATAGVLGGMSYLLWIFFCGCASTARTAKTAAGLTR